MPPLTSWGVRRGLLTGTSATTLRTRPRPRRPTPHPPTTRRGGAKLSPFRCAASTGGRRTPAHSRHSTRTHRLMGAGRAAAAGGERGFAMIALLVLMAVMAIAMTVALPAWSTMARREREAELVFRGEQ